MQIRLGNRQDQPAVTKLVYEVMEEFGLKPNPEVAESDLKNIEVNYFGTDGLFLVAEDEKQIIGIAGARRSTDHELELVRLAVAKIWRGQGIAKKLITTILEFARDMKYQRVTVEPARQYPGGEAAIRAWDFTSDPSEDAQKLWYYDLSDNKVTVDHLK